MKVSGIDGSRNDGLADDYLTIDCGESGSTLRFIIPILSVFAKRYGLVNYRLDTREDYFKDLLILTLIYLIEKA